MLLPIKKSETVDIDCSAFFLYISIKVFKNEMRSENLPVQVPGNAWAFW